MWWDAAANPRTGSDSSVPEPDPTVRPTILGVDALKGIRQYLASSWILCVPASEQVISKGIPAAAICSKGNFRRGKSVTLTYSGVEVIRLVLIRMKNVAGRWYS